VLFGAVLGEHCIIMEQAVLRGTARHPVRLADHVLVGPHVWPMIAAACVGTHKLELPS
jgi:acetyltransferase-like isoleucine patch superfamily enzyme